ncbi:hypothetical protein M758_6G208300, partial [Ceratodon purpureus]
IRYGRQVVHVAGTKGKGSTVSFISSILRAAGLSVGTYTSPHVTSIRERISAGNSGEPVSAISLRKLMTDVQAIIDEAVAAESSSPTHFEVLTALAFTHFAREKVNVAVVETGLGGARDATNVISAEGLGVAVIVGIGCEHLAALGGTLESIALAKAGIIKENRPVIVGPQRDSRVYDIIEKVAAAKGAPLIAVSRSVVKFKTGILFTCTGHPYQFCDMLIQHPPGPEFEALQKEWKLGNVKLRALGAHQQDNALTAVSAVLALRSQGWQISDSAIRIGLENTEIPGRFQVVGSDSSKALGCHSARLILDGAHTEESAMALAKTLRDGFPSARLAFVVAMASDKDHHSFARALLTEAKPNLVVTTRVPVAGSYGRSCTSEELAECWTHTACALNHPYRYELGELSLDGGEQPSQLPSIASVDSQEIDACTSGIDGEDGQKNGELLIVLSVESIQGAIRSAAAELERRQLDSDQPLIVCVAGSLHAVAAALALIKDKQIQQ